MCCLPLEMAKSEEHFFFLISIVSLYFPVKFNEIYISIFSLFASLVPLSSSQNPKPHHSL